VVDGLNVTIPHKRAVIAVLDDLSSGARTIGAVNTITVKGERLVGENTDAPGFLADLDKMSIPGPRVALVLGAGGSARAVCFGLLAEGWQVRVAARRLPQACELVESFQSTFPESQFHPVSLEPDSFHDATSNCGLIVNCTPVGMSPNTEVSPWPGEVPFPRQAGVYDLVYNPRETALSRAAREAGLPARTGLGMLVEQAAIAFELWTGWTADRDAMYAAVAY
jgi:shikimate dehydrogenase